MCCKLRKASDLCACFGRKVAVTQQFQTQSHCILHSELTALPLDIRCTLCHPLDG
jgi:hypothetical protein